MLNKTLNVPSTMVARRMEASDLVLWALKTFGTEMVMRLNERHAPLIEEGLVMPHDAQLQLFVIELTQVRDRLSAAARGHREQKAQEIKFRGLRNTAVDDVNAKMAGLRSTFRGVYDDAQLAELGLTRRNPRSPEVLLEQAATVAVHLGAQDLVLSGSQFGQFDLDAATLAQELEPSAETLKQALSDLRREERQTQLAQSVKDAAMDDFNRAFQWIARTLESNLRFVGLDDLAAKVRPSTRRPGLTERQAEAEGDQPAADGTDSDDTVPVDGEASSEDSPSPEAVIES
ncbi:MAG: hypothetical protein GY719_40320 [bacterium]|nr:hypothetical protein [bacterium]